VAHAQVYFEADFTEGLAQLQAPSGGFGLKRFSLIGPGWRWTALFHLWLQ